MAGSPQVQRRARRAPLSLDQCSPSFENRQFELPSSNLELSHPKTELRRRHSTEVSDAGGRIPVRLWCASTVGRQSLIRRSAIAEVAGFADGLPCRSVKQPDTRHSGRCADKASRQVSAHRPAATAKHRRLAVARKVSLTRNRMQMPSPAGANITSMFSPSPPLPFRASVESGRSRSAARYDSPPVRAAPSQPMCWPAARGGSTLSPLQGRPSDPATPRFWRAWTKPGETWMARRKASVAPLTSPSFSRAGP